MSDENDDAEVVIIEGAVDVEIIKAVNIGKGDCIKVLAGRRARDLKHTAQPGDKLHMMATPGHWLINSGYAREVAAKPAPRGSK